MKILFLALITLSAAISYSYAYATAEYIPLTDKDILVTIDGMSCEPCADTINKVFRKDENVVNTSVSLEDKTLTIDTKDNQDISDAKIKELIEWGGYDLVSIERLKN
jgi:copper chaperone CopZ